MDYFVVKKECKYCHKPLELCRDEGLMCSVCNKHIHVKCLKRGSTPGGLYGDLFFSLICQECSSNNTETFCRNKMSWLQVINLVLYHLQNKSPGLARKGFFHWRNHVATFVDKNWEILFSSDVKKKKKWTGTIAGTLSHFSSFGIFLSGSLVFNEPAWWTINYPKLSPIVLSNIYAILSLDRQKAKLNHEKKLKTDAEMFQEVLQKCISDEELIQPFNVTNIHAEVKEEHVPVPKPLPVPPIRNSVSRKRTQIIPSIDSNSKKILKLSHSAILSDDLTSQFSITETKVQSSSKPTVKVKEEPKESIKLLDPFCHYNTSIKNFSRLKSEQLLVKLIGGIRQELILSPYSGIYLKPYIRRDTTVFPQWLKLMAELQLKVNKKDENYVLPPREPLDYTYVQPEHIPAINSLCNQFFWPGIDFYFSDRKFAVS
ncbi:cysteine-rich protein 2-binding protein isoform X2 [Aethina tumida]|uniref:cysteine-rich protein 2-binding protein isoform X2 n=1 Tax=Aethina tumida TaxID=116153 RepID=UPI00096B279B|nr:cysteine-rich protein 2-binding protein isoform X2 [Aethina tumida]